MGIVEENGMVTDIFFGGADVPEEAILRENPWIKKTSGQPRGYLAGELHGTEVLFRVGKVLQAIPYGESGTYRECQLAHL
jgi:hypothetical protein